MNRDTIQLKNAISTISQKYLLEFTFEYGIPESFHPELPGPEDPIVEFLEGKVGVYTKFFEFANFSIPISQFLFDILDMDLFSLISAPNLAKVKTETRPRAAHEVSILTAIANHAIDMEDMTRMSESSRTPSTVEKSLLEFSNEDPLLLITKSEEMKDHVQNELSQGILPVGNPPYTEVAPEPALEKETVSMGALVKKRHRKSGPDEAKANAPPRSSRKAVVTKDPNSEKSASFTSMVGSPGSIYHPGWSVTKNCRLDTPAACQDMVDQVVPSGYFSELRHLPNDEFLNQYNITMARQVAMGSQLSDHQLSQQVFTLQAQVTGKERIQATFKEFKKYEDDWVSSRCAEIDARLDALSIDFDRELYPHMLTAIASRRSVIGHGLRLAITKCVESTKWRQVFVDVVSVGIAKGMSKGLKHGVEHRKAKVDLAAIEAYDPEANTKYVVALHALNDLKYPLVDQLERLKDSPINVIMSSLFLESDLEKTLRSGSVNFVPALPN
nr:transposase (putative), gypsy type [Tanacetum cinerariifolium]